MALKTEFLWPEMFLQLCSLVPGIFKSLKIFKIRIFDIGEQISEYSVVVELFRPRKGAISGLEIDLLMGNRKVWGEGRGCSSASDAVYHPVLFQWPESPALSQMGGKSLRGTL